MWNIVFLHAAMCLCCPMSFEIFIERELIKNTGKNIFASYGLTYLYI